MIRKQFEITCEWCVRIERIDANVNTKIEAITQIRKQDWIVEGDKFYCCEDCKQYYNNHNK